MNAVINAARAGVSLLGGTLYLYGENMDGSAIENFMLCQMCRRVILNAGLEKVYIFSSAGNQEFDPNDWLEEVISLKGY